MRHISKDAPPAALQEWLGAANENWTPTWSAFGGAVKAETKAALLVEQGSLCAYCCERVDARRAHIEHVVPRSGPEGAPGRALDYTNVVASCFGREGEDPRLARGAVQDLHCGHHKGSTFDASRFVSPLDSACETAFVFNGLGRIDAAGEGATGAEYTIGLLNLDAVRLRRGREAAISGVESVLLDLNGPERTSLLARLGLRQADGTFVEYSPAILSALSYLTQS